MDVIRQQRIQGMTPNPWGQSQHLVRHGAELHADVPALHLLHDVGVPRKREPVSDPLRAQEQRVVDVAVRLRAQLEGLAAVKEEGDVEVLRLALPAELDELGGEVLQGELLCSFFADEVKAWGRVSFATGALCCKK